MIIYLSMIHILKLREDVVFSGSTLQPEVSPGGGSRKRDTRTRGGGQRLDK